MKKYCMTALLPFYFFKQTLSEGKLIDTTTNVAVRVVSVIN